MTSRTHTHPSDTVFASGGAASERKEAHGESAAQVRSIIDRVLRVKEGGDIALGRAIQDRIARLEYVLAPLTALEPGSTIALDRAYHAGGRLLGVRGDTVKDRVRAVRRRGSVAATLASLEKWMAWTPWDVPALDGDLLGFVYAMAAVDFPGVVKVGFSRSPRQRLVSLQREFRVRLDLVHYAPATEFDEHLIQHRMSSFGLAGEWFDLIGTWETAIPEIRLYTAERMWREMREAA